MSFRQENQLWSSELNGLKSQCYCRDLAFIGLTRYMERRHLFPTTYALQDPGCRIPKCTPASVTCWGRHCQANSTLKGLRTKVEWAATLLPLGLGVLSAACGAKLKAPHQSLFLDSPPVPPNPCHTQTSLHTDCRERKARSGPCRFAWSPSQAQSCQRRNKER